MNKLLVFVSMPVILSMLASCAPANAPQASAPQQPTATQAPAATHAPAAQQPTANGKQQVEFTKEEIGEHGVGDATGLWFTTVLYLRSKGMSVEEWAEFVGEQYAAGWEPLNGKGAQAVMREAVADWISCGAKLVSFTGDENRAEAVLEWPPVGFTGVPAEEAQKVNAAFIPITRQVGLKFAWENVSGSQFRLIFFKD